ncbi:MAG: radical SAM protein [Syntrophales bacterium]|nr:radical SAM protein [Syntrophales bacterium]
MTVHRRLWPIIAFFLQRRVLGRKTPLLASFKLSYQCNLACLACPFHRKHVRHRISMDRPLAMQRLTDLYRKGVPIVVFEGGEPLLWRDGDYGIRELITYARTLFPRIAVTTNGTLPLDVPADMVWVSLDGPKEIHDRLRSGSFDRVWSHLRTANHKRLFVHYTVNRDNWRHVGSVLDMLSLVPHIRGLTVQFFYPYHQGEESLALSREERRAVIGELLQLKRRGMPILNSSGRLRAMMDNKWRCRDDLLINVDPDGTITQGCYVKNRGRIDCYHCGFTPVAEASGALALKPGSLWAGWRIFVR